MGRRCNKASPEREPTARLTQNWMTSWKALVQEVHRSITIPTSAVRVITTLARVAYKYPKERRRRSVPVKCIHKHKLDIIKGLKTH